MFEPNLLKDKSVLITGGATGIGYAIAETAGLLGARISIVSRNEGNLKKAVKSLSGKGVRATYRVVNVKDITQVQSAIDSVYSEMSGINALVNNAAGNFLNKTEKISPNGFNAVIDTVLKGTLNCTTTLGKKWISDGVHGNILNIVTTYAWTGSAFVVPSAVSKAGVLAMTRSLAVEWGLKGIRVNAIAPGPFMTEGMTSRLMPSPEILEMVKTRNPLKRFGELKEISNLAVFLLSDGSGFINGEVVTIDGGEWLMGAGQFSAMANLDDSFWDYIDKQRPQHNQ